MFGWLTGVVALVTEKIPGFGTITTLHGGAGDFGVGTTVGFEPDLDDPFAGGLAGGLDETFSSGFDNDF